MSYEIIGISGSRPFERHSELGSSASSITALSGYLSTQSNVSEAVGNRPSARAPDNPSSTR